MTRTVQTESNQVRLNCRGAARSRNFTAKVVQFERKTKFFLSFSVIIIIFADKLHENGYARD